MVGRGVERLVNKEKKGLVQREEEIPVYNGQGAVKKARAPRTRIYGLTRMVDVDLLLKALQSVEP